MARYRKIDPRIWNDAKFSALSHEAQRAFFFVLTHPAMTALGAFRITREGMAAELGLAGKGFAEPFGELLEKGLVKYDESAFLLFVPNFLKYNPPENPNVIKSWEGSIDYLPECPLLVDVLAKASACAANTDAGSKAFAKTLGRVYETLSERHSKPLLKGMPKQEQEQEQEQEIESTDVLSTQAQAPASTPVRRRKRPSSACPFAADAVIPADYLEVAQATGVGNPQACFGKFVNHALANDRRLVDWKAGFRTWCANELQYHPNQQTVRKPLSQRTAADYADWLS